MSDDKPKVCRLVLMDENGALIGAPKNVRMDIGIADSEWSIKQKAKELYRDYLFHIGEWNEENRARLSGFWTDK